MSIITRQDSGMGCMKQVVHGVGLTSFDFGNTKGSYNYENGQMCRVFIPKPATKEILEKYHITLEEYEEICGILVMEFTDWKNTKPGAAEMLDSEQQMVSRLWPVIQKHYHATMQKSIQHLPGLYCRRNQCNICRDIRHQGNGCRLLGTEVQL